MKECVLEIKDRYILIGLNIKYYRNKLGITQFDLAEKAGLGRGLISHLEAPDMYQSTSLKSLFKIADALNVPTYKLLKFRDYEDD